MSKDKDILVIKKGSNKLIMREHVGTFGDDESGIKGTLLNQLNRAPIIEFENGDMVVFGWAYLINKALDILNENREEEEQENE